MPTRRVRKTNRGKTPRQNYENAAASIRLGESLRSAAKSYGIDKMTLKRYMNRLDQCPVPDIGYEKVSKRNKILTEEMESDLSEHIKLLAKQFHGLSRRKCQEFAYQFASQNNIKVPPKWGELKRASDDWYRSFSKRQRLSIRTPEATSCGRASAFNKYNTDRFFDNLAHIQDQYSFTPQQIYNLDETGCTTVQTPGAVVAELGCKQVGSVTSAERGQLVTAVYTVRADGCTLPPMLIFPRVNYRRWFIADSPVGTVGAATKSGWINEDIFVEYLDHVIEQTGCSKDRKILLIMDNHESHVSLAAIDKAKNNGIVMLTIPPHCSHKMQPLDVTVFGPFKKAYNTSMDNWMRLNPGKNVTIYDVPKFVSDAQMSAMTPANIISAFRKTGICPFNRAIFGEDEYAPAAVTDREEPDSGNESVDGEESFNSVEADLQDPSVPEPAGQSAFRPEPEPSTSRPGPKPRPDKSTSSLCREQVPSSKYIKSPPPVPDRNKAPGYVSPADLIPIPKAPPRKMTTKGRPKGKTLILTNTPVRDEIAERHREKASKPAKRTKAKASLFRNDNPKKAKVRTNESDDCDSDFDVLLQDSDSDVNEVQEPIEGDFVIVSVSGKSRKQNYIARIDRLNEDGTYDGCFMKRLGKRMEKPTFIIDECDEASFGSEDLLKILPPPITTGPSARTAGQFVFSCDLSKWQLH